MKMGWTGKESVGKSQLMAVEAEKVYARNKRWMRRRERMGLPFVPRTMATDSPFSPEFVKRITDAGMKYIHFRDLTEVIHIPQCDIFINEINKFFPQRGTEPLNRELAEFLSQAAKRGVDIYFCSQDFSQAHKQFRFLVNELYHVIKMFGSPRPIESAPPVKFIWGIVFYWAINPDSFKGDNFSMKSKYIIPGIYWINKRDTQLYDTLYQVQGSALPPVKMVEQDYIYVDRKGTQVKKTTKWARR